MPKAGHGTQQHSQFCNHVCSLNYFYNEHWGNIQQSLTAISKIPKVKAQAFEESLGFFYCFDSWVRQESWYYSVSKQGGWKTENTRTAGTWGFPF